MSNTNPFEQRDPSWSEVKLPFLIASGRSFISPDEIGQENQKKSIRYKVFCTENSETSWLEVVGGVRFYEPAQGPPAHAHGGALAYILDETMGAAAWVNKYPVVAARLNFEYPQRTPLDQDLEIGAVIDSIVNGRVLVHGFVRKLNGTVLVKSTGEFVILKKSKIAALFPGFEDQLKTTSQMDASSIHDFHWAQE